MHHDADDSDDDNDDNDGNKCYYYEQIKTLAKCPSIHHPSTVICHYGRFMTEQVLPLLMSCLGKILLVSCLGKILARVVSRCLPRSLGFAVSFSHNGVFLKCPSMHIFKDKTWVWNVTVCNRCGGLA